MNGGRHLRILLLLCRSVIHCDLELLIGGGCCADAITAAGDGLLLDTSDIDATELAVAHTACLLEDEAACVRACRVERVG